MTSLIQKYFKGTSNWDDENRVYGPEDFDESFSIQTKVLKIIGLRIVNNLSKFRSRCCNAFFYLELSVIMLCLCSLVLSIYVTFKKATTFEERLTGFGMLPCFGFTAPVMLKGTTMKRRLGTFRNLYHELRAMWPQGKVPEEEHQMLSAALKQLNIMIKAYNFCNVFLILCFLIPPYHIAVNRYLGDDSSMTLPYAYWMPFDKIKPIIFELFLFTQTWRGSIVFLINEAGDMLFCSFLAHIAMQMDLLALRVRRFIHVPVDPQVADSYPLAKFCRDYLRDEEDAPNTYTDRDWEVKQLRDVSEIAQRHLALIRLVGDMEDMYSFTMLVNFIYSSILICLCGFFSVCVEKWSETGFKTFLVMGLSQTWLLCWHGQKLLDSSANFTDAIYECGWYNASTRIRSSVLIMLVRAQDGVRITTYGFSVISLPSYSTLIKTSWSYFTLLLNLIKPETEGL